MNAVICVLNVTIYVLQSSCIYCAVGYAMLGACHVLMLHYLGRKATFEQMLLGIHQARETIHQAREAFTKSLNILLFCPNCDDKILNGEIFSLALQYIITLLMTVLADLAATYGMKIDEETIDEKATSMISVMCNLIIFPLLM